MIETQSTDNFNDQSATSLSLIFYELRLTSIFSLIFFHLFHVLVHFSSDTDET